MSWQWSETSQHSLDISAMTHHWIQYCQVLTHWGRVAHICFSKLTIIGSDNGLSPDRPQAIIWTNAGILSIGPLGTKLSEILIAIDIFSFKKMHLKMSSGKWQPSCLSLNVLRHHIAPPDWQAGGNCCEWSAENGPSLSEKMCHIYLNWSDL